MISVCMATYNGEKYILSQIQSILRQLHDEDEIIISDDSSSDNTLKIVREINDARIKIYIHDRDHGYTRNFENALSKASGDIIFLSDQDDEWFPNKVEKTMQVLQSADFTVSDCITVDENNEVIDQSRFKTFNIKKGFWRLMIKTRYLGCCMAFRRNVLNAALPFPSNSFYIEHDLWLASVAECFFRVELIDEPLIWYKRHKGNVSDAGFNKGYSIPIKIIRRVYRLSELIKRKKIVKAIKG